MNALEDRQPTLGERLARQVELMQCRQTPRRAWQGLVESVLARDQQRRAGHADRWQRREPPARPIVSNVEDAEPTEPPSPLPTRQPDPRVREVLGAWAPTVRIHDDAPAAEMAARHRADAVTIGTEIFLGTPAVRAPDIREQVIVHELTHVAHALDPHAAWHRMTATGIEREERRAVAAERATIERTARQPARSPLIPATPPPPVPAPLASTPAASPSSPAMRPMAADPGRDLTSEQPVTPVTTSPLTNDHVMQALMLKIRTDYERGG